MKNDLFGCYAKIPTGASKELFYYKVINCLESNTYQNVPIMGTDKAKVTDNIVPIVSVIQCGVSEDRIIRVPLSECEIINPLEKIIYGAEQIADRYYSNSAKAQLNGDMEQCNENTGKAIACQNIIDYLKAQL